MLSKIVGIPKKFELRFALRQMACNLFDADYRSGCAGCWGNLQLSAFLLGVNVITESELVLRHSLELNIFEFARLVAVDSVHSHGLKTCRVLKGSGLAAMGMDLLSRVVDEINHGQSDQLHPETINFLIAAFQLLCSKVGTSNAMVVAPGLRLIDVIANAK